MIAFKFKVGFRFNVSREEAMRKPLTADNARAINERCPSVEYVSPYLFADWRQIHRAKYKGNDVYNIDIGGTEEGYAAGGTVMLHGRFLSDMDNRHHLPVAVIGEDLGKAWFRNIDPIGKWFDLDGHQFEVIGVMQRPAASFPGEEDLRVLLPYITMHKMFPAARENMLVIFARGGQTGRGHGRGARRAAPGAPRSRTTSPTISTSPRRSRWWRTFAT